MRENKQVLKKIFNPESLAKLKEEIHFPRLIKDLGASIAKGPRGYAIECPFQETTCTPAAVIHIDEQDQTYRCQSCQKGGGTSMTT